LKAINFLFLMAIALIGAVIKYQSFTVAVPFCFTLIALVVVFYLDLEDYRKIKAIDKRVDDLESSLRSLKSSMNLKNL